MITPCFSHLARFGTALLALSGSALMAADYATTVLSHHPVGYWRFNETAPPSPALNLVTNYGSVGSSGDGVAVRQVTKGQPGIVGHSILLYNGGVRSIECDSKVDVPFNAGLNPHPPFMVELWAKPTRNDLTLCAISSLDAQLNSGG